MEDNTSPFIRTVRMVLLLMIVVGVALIFTRDMWVPKIVNYILSYDTPDVVIMAEVGKGAQR